MIIVIPTVAQNVLTSEDIAETQQDIDPSTKVCNKLMDFYEALRATNPNTKLLPWSTKDKRKLDNTTKALLKLQDLTPFFQGAKPIESEKLSK